MPPILIVVSALVVAVLIVAVKARRDRAAFEEHFPPISDDEFMARCRPGTSRGVALRVRRIVADRLGVEYERIYPSTRFVEDLAAD